ncbi:MAG: chromate efflux transporter, partial [Luteolibacter sp.]
MSSNPSPRLELSSKPQLRGFWAMWAMIGLLGFGGPAGQIALMHRELIERRRWLSERQFVRALNFCMLLPGPEAQQLAIYCGWLLHGKRGGLIAGSLFVLPGACLMGVVSIIYVYHRDLPWMGWMFDGLKSAVMAIVAAALWQLGKKILRRRIDWLLAMFALVALAYLELPFPLLILVVMAAGFLMAPRGNGACPTVDESAARSGLHDEASLKSSIMQAAVWMGLCLLPPVLCLLVLGKSHLLSVCSWFFTKAAALAFGGAYAVLSYVSQQAVNGHGWITADQMMDGLGLAETTPGPLVLVLQFIGFLCAWNFPGDGSPWLIAACGGLLASWAIFLPGFLYVFAAAPWYERYSKLPRLEQMIRFVSAAIVGVIANLALCFCLNVVVGDGGAVDLLPLLPSLVFLLLLRSEKCSPAVVVGLGAVYGLIQ